MAAVPGAGDGASLTSCPGAGVDRPATRALPFNVVQLGVRTIETPMSGEMVAGCSVEENCRGYTGRYR
jgi:hypothetical protein